MTTIRPRRSGAPLARLLPLVPSLLLLLLSLLSVTANARDTRIEPTGQPGDYARVRNALRGVATGDTLTLLPGIFDWSMNLADSTLIPRQPGGMPIAAGGIVIRGVRSGPGAPGTILRGAIAAAGGPVRPSLGTNAAFRNAPGANRVTVEDLTFENFENAIILIQADTLLSATPVNALKDGTRGWTLQRLTIRGGPFGIMANGRHEDLTIRDCEFAISLPPHQKKSKGPREGSFAIAVRPYPPAYPGLPSRVTIERNRAVGPNRKGETEMFGGLILTSRHGRMVDNQASGWGIGLVVEGDSLTVTGNTIENCRIGIVAWSTERLGTSTSHASITNNTVRGTTRQASGLLSDFTGTALFLAGLHDSRIEGNRFGQNAGPGIVFGAMTGTKPSSGNILAGNGGTVVVTEQCLQKNEITGSEVRVVGNRPNPVIPSDTSKVEVKKP